MSDGFAELIDRANAFFVELAKDNNKSFYEPRKDFYRDQIKKPAELFGDLFAEDLARLTGQAHRPKLFRIHRDVRFSKDKTPYNTHLHLSWTRPDAPDKPAWFFGASPEYLVFMMGLPRLDGPALTRFRQLIDTDGDRLSDAIAEARQTLGADLADFGPPPLKRVPKPYAPDHKQAELLKRKGFTLRVPLPDGWREDGLLPVLNRIAPELLPIWQMLEADMPTP